MVTRGGVTRSDLETELTSAGDGLPAAFDRGIQLLASELADACQGQWSWLGRVRACVLRGLAFLESHPRWAMLLLVDAQGAGLPAIERREQALQRLAAALAQRSPRPKLNRRPIPPRELTAELIVGGVVAVVQNRMLKEQAPRLSALAPYLMSMIVLPYLGPEAANAELRLATQIGEPGEAPVERPSKLPIRATYRTALVLQAIAAAPRASNREIAMAAGLSDEGQISKMLRRLERQGVIENVGLGHAYGERNAWLLTPTGERAAQLSARSASGRNAQSRPRGRRARRSCRSESQ